MHLLLRKPTSENCSNFEVFTAMYSRISAFLDVPTFAGETIPDVSNEIVAIVFKGSKYMVHVRVPRFKIMATRFFETSRTSYPATQRHIPEDRMPQVGFNPHIFIL